MADVCDDVFTEWRVVPEDLVPLSALSLVCRGRFILEDVLITALVKCFLTGVRLGQMSDCRMRGAKGVC